MKWMDYQKKLGLNFDDNRKALRFYAQIHNYIDDAAFIDFDRNIEKIFCNMIGVPIVPDADPFALFGDQPQGLQRAWIYLSKRQTYFLDFLSCCVALINSYPKKQKAIKNGLRDVLLNALDDCQVSYEIFNDEDGIFIFPKGAKELDDALVSEPLEWLSNYPNARKAYVTALKQYSDGIYIRDVADNLRKALETFLQEFLANDKNLETNKNEICKYLGAQSVDAGIAGLFQPLINAYKNINDRVAKHNDKVDKKLLEFLLYQTGVLIRMVLVVKQAEVEGVTDAD